MHHSNVSAGCSVSIDCNVSIFILCSISRKINIYVSVCYGFWLSNTYCFYSYAARSNIDLCYHVYSKFHSHISPIEMCMKLVAHTAAYYAAAVSLLLLLLSSLFASLALIVAFIHIRSYSTTYSSLSERQRTKKGDGSHLGVGNNQLLIKKRILNLFINQWIVCGSNLTQYVSMKWVNLTWISCILCVKWHLLLFCGIWY